MANTSWGVPAAAQTTWKRRSDRSIVVASSTSWPLGATTTALARRLGVTPSAVSQHLAVLHRGGLVDKRRSGRAVLYQTTALGLALLGGDSASSGASAS